MSWLLSILANAKSKAATWIALGCAAAGLMAWATRARRMAMDKKTRRKLDESLIAVGKWQAKSIAMKGRLGEHHAASKEVQRRLDAAKRDAVETMQGASARSMSIEEIQKEFKRLGL